MNGRKYGHNYAPRAHGFNLRAKAFPVGYYAPKRFERLKDQMCFRHICSYKRIWCQKACVCGNYDEIFCFTHHGDGWIRKLNYSKTLGWWERVFEN